MISSYDQPSKTEQIARSRTRRRRAARPMRICVPGGICVYDFIFFRLRAFLEVSRYRAHAPRALALRLLFLTDQAFPIHQFGVENRSSSCSPNCVMAEHPKFVIE